MNLNSDFKKHIECSREVSAAFAQKKPLLALESTLITHGIPYPKNMETALLAEEIVREHDVVPATIALLNGKIKIGLEKNDFLNLIEDEKVIKASTRDLSYLISKNLTAGTTVAATLFCATLANIKVFATGGMGGVHRGDAQDISADLIELSRTPVAMVCAGVKSILDIAKTLEMLETLSIPVIGFNSDFFPAFYTRQSAYPLTMKADDVADLVKLIHMQLAMKMRSGVLIANPIQKEDEIPAAIIEPAISEALSIAEKKQITGKAITPFLLSHIANITQNKSIEANIKLILNNVSLGAKIAKQLHAS